MTLAGKAIAITGSGRGIGKACALLAAELGAAVLVNDIDEDAADEVAALIAANGGRALADGSDVSQWKGAAQLIDRCVEEFGTINGLVNNAAIFSPCRFEDADEALWRSTLQVNVCGVAFPLSHAVRHMLAHSGGAIINLTSGAHQGAPDLAPYGTSKGAVAALTRCAAVDLGARGIRVNAVSPVAATRMLQVASDFAEAQGKEWMSNAPTPEANAPVVCYLLSDESAAFNGQILRVERDGVSLLAHPTVLSPYPKMDASDYAAVAAALSGGALGRMQPLGIHYGHVEPA